jgi:DNA-binding NarL/FixJ family response regulator
MGEYAFRFLRTESPRLVASTRIISLLNTPSSAVRIVIVEDHLMFREVLRKLCADELRHEVVGEADDGEQAVEVVGRTAPDLVLLDLHLPSLDGFGVVEAIRKKSPLVKILVLSSHCDGYTVFRSERAHVQGFVDKNTNSVERLKAAISAVAQGKVWFSDVFLKAKAARHRDPNSFDKVLTDRERAVLTLVGTPLTDAEIARELEIAEETVEKHRFNILRKLGLHSTTELVRYAREHGFTLTARRGDDGALLP